MAILQTLYMPLSYTHAKAETTPVCHILNHWLIKDEKVQFHYFAGTNFELEITLS